MMAGCWWHLILTDQRKGNGDRHSNHAVPEATVVVWGAVVCQILEALEQPLWLEQGSGIEQRDMVELGNAVVRLVDLCILGSSAHQMRTHGRIDAFQRPFLILDAVHQPLTQHVGPALPVEGALLVGAS